MTTEPDHAKIISRVRKLFARARSSNLNESQTANQMAFKLMNQHNLTKEEVFAEIPGLVEERAEGEKFMEIWRWGLLTACAWSKDCHTVRIEEWFPAGPKKIYAVVMGDRDATKSVFDAYSAFESPIDGRTETLVGDGRLHGRSDIESYCRGAVVAIQESILDEKKKKGPTRVLRECALVLVKKNQEKIADHMKNEYHDAVKPRMWQFTQQSSFSDGYVFGRSLVGPKSLRARAKSAQGTR